MYNPLVSIVVITYNSAKYVSDTLNSIFVQSYQNIELIISDDCSQDNTVNICREWLQNHSKRFRRVIHLESPINTGISENLNRGYIESEGEWVYGIAGDDLLIADCIKDNIDFVLSRNASVCFSNCIKFRTGSIPYQEFAKDNNCVSLKKYDVMSIQGQFEAILKLWQPPSATMFIRRSLIEKLEYFDPAYPFMEDYPFLIKLVQNNIRLHFFDKPTALYRTDSGVCSNTVPSVSIQYYLSKRKFFFHYLKDQYPRSLFLYKYHQYVYFFCEDRIIKYFQSRTSLKAKLFRKIFTCIDPIAIGLFFKRKKKLFNI